MGKVRKTGKEARQDGGKDTGMKSETEFEGRWFKYMSEETEIMMEMKDGIQY